LGNLGQTDGESCQKVLKKGGDRVIRQPASDRNSLLYKLLGIASKVVPYDFLKRKWYTFEEKVAEKKGILKLAASIFVSGWGTYR
jgi:hypothetical protein